MTVGAQGAGGYMVMDTLPDDEDFWLLPYAGNVITRWNPETEEVREYPISTDGFVCHHIPFGHTCMERPFGSSVCYKNSVYLSPCWGNMYIRLDKDTGEAVEWKPDIEKGEDDKNGYFTSWAGGYLGYFWDEGAIGEYRLFSVCDRELYQIDFETGQCQKIEIPFDMADLSAHEPGFREQSQWLQYACQENAFNSLPDLLDGTITGDFFDKERQIKAYRQLAANSDGTCGEKIHCFIRGKIEKGEEADI